MLSLSKIALETRLIVKWGGISLGAIILLFIFIQIGISAKGLFFPTPPDPPTVSFGKLPAIIFPNDNIVENFKYELDTTTGSLPEFPDRLRVFKIEKPEPHLLAVERAEKKMQSIGIFNKGSQVDSTIFSWVDQYSTINTTYNYNIFSRNFRVTSQYQSDPQVLNATGLFEEQVAINTAKMLINSLSIENKEKDSIDLSKTKTNLYSIKNGTLLPATSISNAQIIEVFFFQKDVDELPIFYSHPNKSTMSFLVSGGTGGPQVVQADFSYQNVSSESATYPIKTTNELFKDLKNGKGFISSYNGKNKTIKIKNIFPAYYISEKEQDFLMPIVIFEGTDDFYAYLPAIKDEWLSN